MTISPDDDLLEKEIESWRGFWETLREEDRQLFKEMLQESRKYSPSIAVKAEPFPVEPLLMSLLLEQYKKAMKYRKQQLEQKEHSRQRQDDTSYNDDDDNRTS